MSRALLGALLASATGVLPGCAAEEPHPLGAAAIRRAFALEGIELVRRSIGPEADRWGALLVASDQRVPVEVLVYANPTTARNLSTAFDSFQRPPGGVLGPRSGGVGKVQPPLGRFRLTRRANAVVVVPSDAEPELRARIERALSRLPAA